MTPTLNERLALPDYPATLEPPYPRLFAILHRSVKTLPADQLAVAMQEIDETLAEWPGCEFEEYSRCGAKAVTRCVGLDCCLEHAQVRARSLGL